MNCRNMFNKKWGFTNDEFLCTKSYLSLHSVSAVEIIFRIEVNGEGKAKISRMIE